MITLRKAEDRGHFDHGWLDTHHTFSFGHYVDREQRGFRSLRVINEDFIEPGRGFGTHGHADMEIITYVVAGAVAHEDSMGSVSTLEPGDIQVMSAGSGLTHSEFNPSETERTHMLQIWILPARQGTTPRYEDRTFPLADRRGTLVPIASGNEAPGAIAIGQDATVYASVLPAGDSLSHELAEGRGAWVQLVRGSLLVNGETLEAGDGARIEGDPTVEISAPDEAEFLLFDLA